MSENSGFLEELKRRKVVRVAVVYLAVAWALVQVADVFVPALGLPEEIITVVAVLALLGFPVALALGWAFELTRDGVRRTDASGAGGSSRWVSPATIAAAGGMVAVGFLAGSFMAGGDGGGSESELDATAVAVLPFDVRGAEDEGGFADGVHDDILTQLARLGALRVTSRTSVEGYRGTTKNIREIAAELGVGSVLEGGVQRTADRVRINMQLIDGVTDEHLWAETFDRELTAENLFAIQSEIARAVALALETALTPEDESTLAEVPTTNLEALDLYHRARRLMDEVDPAGRRRAVGVLEAAVELDPGFARAWAELTLARSWGVRTGWASDTLPAREAMDRALSLAPGSIDAALARGHYLYYARGDYEGALAAFREAEGVRAGDVDLRVGIAHVLRRLGRTQEATAIYEEVARREPRNAFGFYELAWHYVLIEHFDDAFEAIERVRALAPEELSVYALVIEATLLSSGDTVAARAALEEWEEEAADLQPAVYRAQLAYFQRDTAALSFPLWEEAGVDRDLSFTSYFLYPDGPARLWRARMAWVLGDTARARMYGGGLEGAAIAGTPLLQAGANAIPEGEDLFGHRASLLLVKAWEALFSGNPDLANEYGDRAVELYPLEADGTDAVFIQRQRMLLRVVTGDLDGAMEDLRVLLPASGYTTPSELRLDPIYDPLRGRADFLALLDGDVGSTE